jgi:hypothetical protein
MKRKDFKCLKINTSQAIATIKTLPYRITVFVRLSSLYISRKFTYTQCYAKVST